MFVLSEKCHDSEGAANSVMFNDVCVMFNNVSMKCSTPSPQSGWKGVNVEILHRNPHFSLQVWKEHLKTLIFYSNFLNIYYRWHCNCQN